MTKPPHPIDASSHRRIAVPEIASLDSGEARRRAIRARCQALKPARMSPRDVRYVRANYLSLREVANRAGRDLADVEGLIDDGLLPRPSYVLPDGTGMFPVDLLCLLDAADDISSLSNQFRIYEVGASARNIKLADDEVPRAWIDYLAGLYGVCLWRVSPETIIAKGIQIEQIETLLSHPLPEDAKWLRALRAAVESLDVLLRPFTGFDRRRFGGYTSRDRLITAVRRSYPQLVG